jgi:CheY-like chemotaxis protein
MNDRILIVDDDPVLASVAGEILELAGYTVQLQTSPFGTTSAAVTFKPAVVLLDVNMPGLSGARLVGLLREGLRHPSYVVLFSSNDEAQLRELVQTTGADGYIKKGDIDTLPAKLEPYFRLLGRFTRA